MTLAAGVKPPFLPSFRPVRLLAALPPMRRLLEEGELLAELDALARPAELFTTLALTGYYPVLPWTIPLKTLVVPESNKRLKARGSPDTIQWTEAYGVAVDPNGDRRPTVAAARAGCPAGSGTGPRRRADGQRHRRRHAVDQPAA